MTNHNAIRKHVYLKIHDDRAEGYIDPIPKDLVGAIKWLQEKLELVPAEWRDQVYFDLYVDRNEERPFIEIAYSRPETDDEFNGRLSTEKTRKELEQEGETRLLHALKKKYFDEV